jgi:hypothetical protein
MYLPDYTAATQSHIPVDSNPDIHYVTVAVTSDSVLQYNHSQMMNVTQMTGTFCFFVLLCIHILLSSFNIL